jgi:hypothetical protein
MSISLFSLHVTSFSNRELLLPLYLSTESFFLTRWSTLTASYQWVWVGKQEGSPRVLMNFFFLGFCYLVLSKKLEGSNTNPVAVYPPVLL